MELIAIPTNVATQRKWLLWVAVAFASIGVLAVLFALVSRLRATVGPGTGGGFYSVRSMDLNVTIAKDGELAAVNNIDILCRVEGGSTIQTLIKEGSSVKKGDVLITLDSSGIRQKIEDTTLDLQKAEADLTTSKEMREIQISQNNANLEAAEVELTLAELDLQGYEQGSYPQQLAQAQSDFELAKLALKNAEENLAQTRNLFTKNFVTATDVKKAEQDVVKSIADVSRTQNALEVLTKYTHQSDLASKKNALSQAEQKLVRTEKENASNLSQKNADVSAKEQALEVMKRRMERFEEQLAACTIIAPTDGLVVYTTSGDRNAQSALQEGAQVRERQALLRLPDTSSMKAVVRIPEASVWRLAEGQRATVSLTNGPPIEATLTQISVLADNTQRWMNPDVKEYPVDLVLDHTPKGLKPGMGVRSEILIDRVENALAVPLNSIYTADGRSFVFVRDGDAMKPAEVKLGRVNNEYAEVTQGISSGQQVKFLQIGEGPDLLARAGIKLAENTNRAPTRGPGRRAAGDDAPGANGAVDPSASPNAAVPVAPEVVNPNGAALPGDDANPSMERPRVPGGDGQRPPGSRRGGGRRGGQGGAPGGQPPGQPSDTPAPAPGGG